MQESYKGKKLQGFARYLVTQVVSQGLNWNWQLVSVLVK